MYCFMHDFFSQTIPQAEQYLSRFIGNEAHFLEIGSFEGVSATWFLDHILTHSLSTITCVDPWEFTIPAHSVVFDNFKHNISFHSNKVIYYKNRSINILTKLIPDYYDFIYVDGDHSSRAVLEDAVLSFRILKIGGILAFDDYLLNDEQYLTDGTTIKESIDAFIYAYRKYLTVLHKDWQVWIMKHA